MEEMEETIELVERLRAERLKRWLWGQYIGLERV